MLLRSKTRWKQCTEDIAPAPTPRQSEHFDLFATKPAADSALCFRCLVFHRLVELVNGTVELSTCLLAHFLCSGFGFGEFGFGVSRLFIIVSICPARY